jgi:4-hydroxybenzoate polyprenyltransferase
MATLEDTVVKPMARRRNAGFAADLLALLRPKQWVKNIFVLPAPLFAQALTTPDQVLHVALAFLSFCLLSSTIYIINDVVDAEADRNHRIKRLRPIAAGRISRRAAFTLAAATFVCALFVAAYVNGMFVLIALAYVVNSVAYSLWLKQLVVTDVFSIALGFMLRILGGAAAVVVTPSSWLLICGFSLALFLGFCKRRSELGRFFDLQEAANARSVLAAYSEEKLNLMITATATMTAITYMLFTVAPETVVRHGSDHLIFSSPIVVYGVFKYLVVTVDLEGEDPVNALLGEPAFWIAGGLWLLCVLWAV